MDDARPRLAIAEAVARLRAGAVLAYPTESVWGLGCDPFDAGSVDRLLALKGRPPAKGMILAAATPDQLDALVDWDALSPQARDTVLATWPGPHTWIVPATPRVPAWIRGAHAGVAVRCSAHPVVAALCAAFGPLVSTSANPSGAPPPQRLDALDPALRAAVDGIVEGETGGLERPTPIRDARSGQAVRP